MANKPMSEMSIDASLDGTERMLSQGADGSVILVSALVAYAIDELVGAAELTPTAGDAFLVERSGTEGTYAIADAEAWVVDTIEAVSIGTEVTGTDWVVFSDAGTLKRITAANFAAYVLGTDTALGTEVAALDEATITDSDYYLVVQAGTAKYTNFDDIAARVHSQFNTFTAALDAVTSPADADKLYTIQGSTAKYITLTELANDYLAAELDIEDFGWDMAEVDPALAGDMILINRSGTGVRKLDIDTLVTYAGSGLQDAVLDFSGLAAATPNAADTFAVDDGGTPKKITLTNLETKLWADFLTYVDGLSENTTVTATDKLYVIQGGTAKWVDPDALATYFSVTDGDVTGPVATTEDNIPQWDATTKKLKDGLELVTTVRDSGSALDTAIATEQAVREAIGGIDGLDIDGGDDIGAALVDADLIIVDDGASGTNRKCAMSRVFTYIETAFQGLDAKTTPLAADILTIQDTAASNSLKELTITNLWDNRLMALLEAETDVSGASWVLDEDTMLSDSATQVPTQQSVKAFASTITNLDIDGATASGALTDADLIIVDDGANGTNRKSTFTQVWAWIVSKLQGVVTKSTPVDADKIVIQDSENADVLTELTVGNLWDNRYQADMLAVTSLATAAWLLDEDDMASNSATKCPSQQSVKAYVDAVGGVTNNFSATGAPGVTDDIDGGYTVGSMWVNVATDAAWICADNTDGAAVWQSVTASAAGWDGDITDTDFSAGADISADLADGDQFVVGDASDSDNPKRSAVSRVKTYVNKIQTASYGANQALTAAECNGYVIYVTGAATITLPAIEDGMSVTIITIGAVQVHVDPNASDKIWLDGTALDDGDKITNASTAGDIAVLTYYSADGWHASTNSWTDGG